MRRIDDKTAFVREIQRFLIKIYSFEENGLLLENGVYDERTKSAVRRFKNDNGLPSDAVVDFQTFDLLYLKYKESGVATKTSLERGDTGDGVLELNMMLRAVGGKYSEFSDYKDSRYFSQNTENAVIYLKERFGMDGDGKADGIFIERLRREYEIDKEFS